MRFSSLALSALILAAPISAFAQQDSSGFTPQQRFLYIQEQRAASGTDWHSLTKDQRREKMRAMRASLSNMTGADLTKLKAHLQAKYDAMSPDQKQAFAKRLANREARRAERRAKGDKADKGSDSRD